MNLKNVENKEKNTAVLHFEVDAAEFEAAVEKAYRKAKGNISVPGFRKGKAPRKIIEGMYGAGVFYEDAIQDVYPKALEAAVEQSGLDVVGYPQVEVDSVGAEGLSLTITVGIRPVAKLGQYKGLEAPKSDVVITDEDVENELKPYINQATRQITVERAAQNGDTVTLDFDGYLNGERFEGGKAEKYNLQLGSNAFIPGFEDQVVGMSAGEEKDINVTFPKDYSPELAGKDVVFKIKVHEVKESQGPVVDDEFAKDVSEFDTLDELKADLAEKLRARRQETAEKAFQEEVLTALIDKMECEVPDTMVDYETDRMIDEYAARFQGQGFSFEQYLSMMGTNINEMRMTVRSSALRQIQGDLAFTAVAEAEGIEASEEEIAAEVKSLAEQYKMEEAEVKEKVPEEDIKRQIRLKKASELVYASAVASKPEEPKAEETKAEEPKAEEPKAEEEKPKRTRTRKSTAAKAAEAEGEEKPKKTTTRKKAVKKEPEAQE